MLKGILEGCLLAVIEKGETYGYEMIERLEEYGFQMISEGSIYPVLMRLQRDGFVETNMKKSPSGPKRKYYTITDKGREELVEFREKWSMLASAMNQLF